MDQHSFEFRTRLEEQLAFWDLPTKIAAEVEERSTPVTYEKGAILFLRGSPANLLFWLFKGFAKLYLPITNGDRILVDLARPGDLLGFAESAYPKGRRQILEAQALTRCSAGLLSREQIPQLLGTIDERRMVHLLEQLNAAWSRLFERRLTFLASTYRTRLDMVFDNLGARCGVSDERGTLIIPELGLDDLAEMIGSSRPLVSKLIADMTEEGLLTRGERHHFILCKDLKKCRSDFFSAFFATAS